MPVLKISINYVHETCPKLIKMYQASGILIVFFFEPITKPAFTSSKSAMETPEICSKFTRKTSE